MKLKSLFAGLLIFAAGSMLPVIGNAQGYPNKQVTIVVPYSAGGGVDRLARIVAEQLHKAWDQPVVVENRPGANGNIGAEYVSRANPDGYTLLYAPPGPLVINKLLFKGLNFDPEKFVPISLVASSPNVLVVNPKLDVKSVKELIAFAKKNPDKLSYASPGTGGTPHLSAELFKSMAGISMVHVPYKGTGPLMTDILAGNVEVTFSELGNVLQHVQAGNLRALAIASPKRNPALPDVPALAETLPGFASGTWSGLVAPEGTPPAVVNKINKTLSDSFSKADAAKRVMEKSHLEAVVSTPDEMAAHIKDERDRWSKVIDSIGLRQK